MTSFTSTAAFYSRYRVPYPESLLGSLKTDADLGRESLVLDLATGPGRLALALAPSVREVVAVDIEPEMLDE
ncbi:MAG: class I SAM-dependent methyltransferase, partial [Gammaproteobacteria bacterium]|nr:class I SAM-dependent methyltransferase [Gammaproteobacteria bacterium]